MKRYCPYDPKQYREGINRNLAENCPYCPEIKTCKWWNRKLQEKPIYERWRMGRP